VKMQLYYVWIDLNQHEIWADSVVGAALKATEHPDYTQFSYIGLARVFKTIH